MTRLTHLISGKDFRGRKDRLLFVSFRFTIAYNPGERNLLYHHLHDVYYFQSPQLGAPCRFESPKKKEAWISNKNLCLLPSLELSPESSVRARIPDERKQFKSK